MKKADFTEVFKTLSNCIALLEELQTPKEPLIFTDWFKKTYPDWNLNFSDDDVKEYAEYYHEFKTNN